MTAESDRAREESLCSMYREGVSLRTLRIAFDLSDEEIIEVLHRHGVVQPEAGEIWDEFVRRVRDDVKHAA